MVKLKASYCKCGQVMVPIQKRCVHCLALTDITEIENSGELLTYTILNNSSIPEGESENLSIVLGLVKINLLNNDSFKNININPQLNLICRGYSESANQEKLKIGAEVQIELVGSIYYFKIL